MTTAPAHPTARKGATGPAEDTHLNHRQTLAAFREAAARSADLWRRLDHPDAQVPGLTWTAAETAAHVVGDLRAHTEALRGRNPVPSHEDSPSRRSVAVNAHHLEVVGERHPGRLADLLEEAAAGYVAAVQAQHGEPKSVPTPNGLVMTPPVMTALLLGEQVVHGLDIARAAERPWAINRQDASLVFPGVLAVAPAYLRRSVSPNLRVSYELRFRGGPRYRFAVENRTATVGPATGNADCVITADPVAFLLLGYGRVAQWRQIVRGKLLAGGRKPWLAAKFATLLSSP
jgi:hypothetical protein